MAALAAATIFYQMKKIKNLNAEVAVQHAAGQHWQEHAHMLNDHATRWVNRVAREGATCWMLNEGSGQYEEYNCGLGHLVSLQNEEPRDQEGNSLPYFKYN